MFENILEEFKKLTTAVDFLSKENATEIVDFISQKIMEELKACAVDLLWRETAEQGIYLKVICSKRTTGREKAKGRFVDQKSHGIWSKVFREGQPIWVESIQSKQYAKSINDGGTDKTLKERHIKLTESVDNKRGGRIEIDDCDFIVYEDTDTIITIPLLYRDTIWGIYSIELERYQRNVEDRTFKEIQDLAQALAIILWKSEIEQQYLKDTHEAINNFKTSILTSSGIISLNPLRIGFMVRSFRDEEFEYVEEYINNCLHKKAVHVEHYVSPPGGEVIINTLMSAIRKAHFGIVDITNNKPNCLLELGMMMILRKRLILLKRKDDDTDVPFNIGSYQYYQYEMQGPSLVFFEPGKKDSIKSEEILDSFIETLKKDKSFRDAKPYTAG